MKINMDWGSAYHPAKVIDLIIEVFVIRVMWVYEPEAETLCLCSRVCFSFSLSFFLSFSLFSFSLSLLLMYILIWRVLHEKFFLLFFKLILRLWLWLRFRFYNLTTHHHHSSMSPFRVNNYFTWLFLLLVLPFAFRFLLNNQDLCSSGEESMDSVDVLFMVHTALLNFRQREALRSTVANQSYFYPFKVRVSWVVSTQFKYTFSKTMKSWP